MKFFILTLFLLSAKNVVLSSTELADPQNQPEGPITQMMDNLAQHTASVTDELLNQLSAKIDSTSKTLAGNIEVVMTSALRQISQPLEMFQQSLNSSKCQPFVTLEELHQTVDSELTKCTQNLNEILTSFLNDAHEFIGQLQEHMRDIVDLAHNCEENNNNNDSGFSTQVNCYVQKISDFNKQIALILNNASMTFVHTRQLAEQAIKEGRLCADNVVASTKETMQKVMANCQLNV